MRILVVGATSFWGRPLVDELRSRGHDVSVFSRDPRAFPDDWRLAIPCHWGSLDHGHILEEALDGADRVVASVSAGRRREQADRAEVDGIRHLLRALSRRPGTDLVRLTSPAPLRDSDWWPMATRRRADLLVETSEVPHCLAEMGWAPEMLAPLLRDRKIWLPHPVSVPGRILWQSRRDGVRKLADLVSGTSLPPRARIRGRDSATLLELSTRACIRWIELERIHLPGRFFHWIARMGSGFGFAGVRLVHAGSQDETRAPGGGEDSLSEWPQFNRRNA
ncbi:MAG TPA: SDR family oxidoreductase [Fibrobacteria bacterium]|nr:SDR family oxidoreductase [Fibrobacteria bacterium]